MYLQILKIPPLKQKEKEIKIKELNNQYTGPYEVLDVLGKGNVKTFFSLESYSFINAISYNFIIDLIDAY